MKGCTANGWLLKMIDGYVARWIDEIKKKRMVGLMNKRMNSKWMFG